MQHYYYLSIPFVVLLNCGGSGGGVTTVLLPEVQRDPFAGVGETQLTPAASGTEIAIATVFGTTNVTLDPNASVGSFVAGFNFSPTEYGGVYFSEGEASQTALAVAGFDVTSLPSNITHSAFYERTTASSLPLSGTAKATGQYASTVFFQSDSQLIDSLAITGDLELDVDFDDRTIIGRVTDRTLVNWLTFAEVPDSVAEDLILSGGGFDDDGEFIGTVSGGAFAISGQRSAASLGTFRGLFAGQEATETVGVIRLGHLYAGSDSDEIGVFATGH